MRISAASITDKGKKRKNNEDSLLVRLSLHDAQITEKQRIVDPGPSGAVFAVADGMGGQLAGEVASMLAIDAIEEMIDGGAFKPGISETQIRHLMDQIFLNAHDLLIERGKEDPSTEKMGTTLVVGLIRDSILHLAWLGDSRCYLYRRGSGLAYLSKDHSYVQMLVDAGRITMDQAFDHPGSNIITRSLMCLEGDDVTPDYRAVPLQQGDRMLFCSDGLNGMLRDQEIEAMLSAEQDVRGCAHRLVSAANEKGGKDNISVIVVEVSDM
jgi:serine/threonine protein phosphatase PrpC